MAKAHAETQTTAGKGAAVGRGHDVRRDDPRRDRARERLEELGYEVLVFHATGAGGRALEDLAGSGLLAGVLDMTTTELADDLVGGCCRRARSGSPRRGATGSRRWWRPGRWTWSTSGRATPCPSDSGDATSMSITRR